MIGLLLSSLTVAQCSIDSDILNLMDEVNLDEFLKETAAAIDDPEKLSAYLREKATIAVERFLVRTNHCIAPTASRLCRTIYLKCRFQ